MKKIILATLCFMLVATFSSSAQKVTTSLEGKRPWWATCLVDAAGALGGAGSVASFINMGSVTPAGWVAIGAGAIVGGAGASLARNASGDVGVETPPIYVPNPNLPTNSTYLAAIENVGLNHNKLISDYYRTYPTFSIDSYWDFILNNGSNYGITKMPFTKEELAKIILNENLNINSLDGINNYLEALVPKSFAGKSDFISTVKTLAASNGVSDLNSRAINIENTFLQSKTVTSKEREYYEFFFSVFRASANLWNK